MKLSLKHNILSNSEIVHGGMEEAVVGRREMGQEQSKPAEYKA